MFEKPSRIAELVVGVGGKKPPASDDDPADTAEPEHDEGQLSAAEDFASAVHGKDAGKILSAFHNLIGVCYPQLAGDQTPAAGDDEGSGG